MDPRLDTKDPGFVRIRSRSDRSENFIKNYLKTKKLEHFTQKSHKNHTEFFLQNHAETYYQIRQIRL